MAVAIHKEIRVFLNDLGLTDTEASLYTAGLRYGPLTAGELAKRTGVRRTTTYSALEALTEKGMAGTLSEAGVSRYNMKDPNLIDLDLMEKIQALKERQLEFSNLLPLFDNLSPKEGVGTTAATYEGIDGVRSVMDMALFSGDQNIQIIAPTQNIFSKNSIGFSEYVGSVAVDRSVSVRALWAPSFMQTVSFKYLKGVAGGQKLLPKVLEKKIQTTILLFSTKVAFVDTTAAQSAVVVDSVALHSSQQLFFDSLWAKGKSIVSGSAVRH